MLMLEITRPIAAAAVLSLASAAAAGVQQTIDGEHDSVVEQVEAALDRMGWQIVEQAQTNRFTLIYATQADRSFVTVTVRSLPAAGDTVEVDLNTDSPPDPALEHRLLQQFSKR